MEYTPDILDGAPDISQMLSFQRFLREDCLYFQWVGLLNGHHNSFIHWFLSNHGTVVFPYTHKLVIIQKKIKQLSTSNITINTNAHHTFVIDRLCPAQTPWNMEHRLRLDEPYLSLINRSHTMFLHLEACRCCW